MKRIPFLAAGAILVAMTLVGCAPGASAPTTGDSTHKVVTDPKKMGKVTITILDAFTDNSSQIGKWINGVDASFMKKYPNITVQRKPENSGDINTSLRLRLADASTPDIVPANQGWQGVGDLGASGLLLNLDAYSKAYHWNTLLPKTIARQHMVASDGKSIGDGSLYGMPINQGSFITVFYNRADFQKLGLALPKTLADFESDLAAAKAAGIVPMQLGTQDQSATPTLLALQDSYGDTSKILNFVYGTGNVKLADTGMVQAADTYAKWAKEGFFPKNFPGINSGDASQKFVDGNGLFYFFYSGFLPFSSQAQGDKFGTFILPREDGSPVTATGSSTQNFSIAAKSKHPDAAALWLNYSASTEAGKIAIQNGLIPIIGNWPANTDSPLLNDGLNELSAINKNDGYVPYFDWSTPTMLDTLNQQIALLLNGRANGTQLVQAAQTNYDAFQAKQKG